MIETPSIIIAFSAGLLSFLVPCVLPLIPSYIGYIAGISLTDSYLALETKKRTWRLFLHSLMFGIGFTGIFMLIGAAVGGVSKLFIVHGLLIQKIGGVLLILLGIYISGILTFGVFFRERKFHLPKFFDRFDYARSFMIGVVFAFGWSPCYGPILGAILTLVALNGSFSYGLVLLGVYSIGFIIPFLAASLFLSTFSHFAKRLQAKLKYVQWFAGFLIVSLGTTMVTGYYNTIVSTLLNKFGG